MAADGSGRPAPLPNPGRGLAAVDAVQVGERDHVVDVARHDPRRARACTRAGCPRRSPPAVSRRHLRPDQRAEVVQRDAARRSPVLPPLPCVASLGRWLGSARSRRLRDGRSGGCCGRLRRRCSAMIRYAGADADAWRRVARRLGRARLAVLEPAVAMPARARADRTRAAGLADRRARVGGVAVLAGSLTRRGRSVRPPDMTPSPSEAGRRCRHVTPDFAERERGCRASPAALARR